MKSKKVFSSKITFLFLLILALFLGRQKYYQIKQNRQIEAEKKKILAQIENLNKKNQEISTSLEYFKSESFKQRVAREQLNLKQPDEQVFSFKTSNQNMGAGDAQELKTTLSNPEK